MEHCTEPAGPSKIIRRLRCADPAAISWVLPSCNECDFLTIYETLCLYPAVVSHAVLLDRSCGRSCSGFGLGAALEDAGEIWNSHAGRHNHRRTLVLCSEFALTHHPR